MATKRNIKVVKRASASRIGDGEWKIPVQIFHKGLRKEAFYKKEELYQMLGDANVMITYLESKVSRLETDSTNMQIAHDDIVEHASIGRELVHDRNVSLLRRFRAWRASVIILAIIALFSTYWAIFK